MTKDNHALGDFDLEDIPPAARGVPQVEVTFNVDSNGILTVTAEDTGSESQNEITITNEKGRLSQEEIDRMIKEAEEFADEDKETKARVDARNALESYIYSMKNSIEDAEKLADKITDEEKETITEAIEEGQTWLNENAEASKEDFQDKLKEIEGICKPIVSKAYDEEEGDEEDFDGHDEL